MVPEHFICPISQLIFYHPVLCQDGHTYEKTMIEKWLKEKNSSPITRQEMSMQFVRCLELEHEIELFLTQHPEFKSSQFKIEFDYFSFFTELCIACIILPPSVLFIVFLLCIFSLMIVIPVFGIVNLILMFKT